MGRTKVNFPRILLYNILVTIFGVLWCSPMDVVYRSKIGQVFDPWVIACIPFIACLSNMMSGYFRNMEICKINRILIFLDILVFLNMTYLLYSDNFKFFIIVGILISGFFNLFGAVYKIKMKDIISKVYYKAHEDYLARDTFANGLIQLVVFSGTLIISLSASDGDYSNIIYYSMVLGVLAIGYEVWFIRPLRILDARYKKLKRTKKSKGEL